MDTLEQNPAIEETRAACVTHPDTCSSGGTMAVWISNNYEYAGAFIDSNEQGTTSISNEPQTE